MNTNNEGTDYSSTRYNKSENEEIIASVNETQSSVNDKKKGDSKKQLTEELGKMGIGIGAGVLIGGVSGALMSMQKNNPDVQQEDVSDNHSEVLSHPEWVDNEVQVATNVNDNMTFNQAFAAARAQVGAGGCFEWHGKLYGTYYADEWNKMTAEEKADYGKHFSWNNIDSSKSDVAHHTSPTSIPSSHDSVEDAQHKTQNADNHHPEQQHKEPEATHVTDDDDIEIISVDRSEGEHDVEILGVTHDYDSGNNVGRMLVDGQEVILVDVDGDMEFDYMASDLNKNGEFDSQEIVDIHGKGYTVDSMGGFNEIEDMPSIEEDIMNQNQDFSIENDTPDFSNDIINS